MIMMVMMKDDVVDIGYGDDDNTSDGCDVDDNDDGIAVTSIFDSEDIVYDHDDDSDDCMMMMMMIMFISFRYT